MPADYIVWNCFDPKTQALDAGDLVRFCDDPLTIFDELFRAEEGVVVEWDFSDDTALVACDESQVIWFKHRVWVSAETITHYRIPDERKQ